MFLVRDYRGVSFSWVGEHGPELVKMTGSETVFPADDDYVCDRCQRNLHHRCTERECECCGGVPGD